MNPKHAAKIAAKKKAHDDKVDEARWELRDRVREAEIKYLVMLKMDYEDMSDAALYSLRLRLARQHIHGVALQYDIHVGALQSVILDIQDSLARCTPLA